MVGQISSYIVRLASTVVLARLLTPEDYGLIAMVAVITQFIALFSDMGLSMSTVQQDQITHQQVSNLFWINILVTSCLGILVALGSSMAAWFYQDQRLTAITLWTAATFPLSGLTLQHFAILKRQMRFAAIARIQVICMAISVEASLFAAWLGMGYWALVIMNISGLLCTIPLVWWTTRWIPSWFTSNQSTRAHLAFGGYLTGSDIAGFFFRNTDRILIGKFSTAHELGLYDRAYQLLMLPLSQVIYPLVGLATPVLSRLQKEPDRYRKVYLEMQEKICFVISPVIGVFIAYNDWIVKLILGDQWLGASSIFAWLSLIGILQATLGMVGSLFISQGRVKESLWWQMATSIMAALSYVVGLPWGGKGVAVSYALSGVCLRVPLYIWWAGRKGPVTVYDIARPVALFSLYGLGLSWLFMCFRSWLSLSYYTYSNIVVVSASLVISYAGYLIFSPTRKIALELLRYFQRSLLARLA